MKHLILILAFLAIFSLAKRLPISPAISANVGNLRLSLQKPETTIFHKNFRVTGVNENELHILTPHPSKLAQIEDQIHVDPISNAAVRVQHINGVMQLYGEVNGHFISYDKSERVHKLEKNNHDHVLDYVEIPHEFKSSPETSAPQFVNRSTNAAVQVELLIVVDYLNYLQFSMNATTITEYFAILVRSVNNRYATSADPSIFLKIVELVIMTSTASQPFIENNGQPGGNYDYVTMLSQFGQYTASQNFIFHDAAALFTAVSLSPAAGVAYMRGACRDGVKVSVNRDLGGIFNGVRVLVHEIGHNIGAPHDGENDAADCNGSDGYIMGTQMGVNGHTFSSCSKRIINQFLSTPESNCLYSNEAPSAWTPSPLQPGDRVNMIDVCHDYRSDAYVSGNHTPDELCDNVRCQFRAPCSPPDEHLFCIWTATLNKPAPDGAPCDIGGRCTLSRCRT